MTRQRALMVVGDAFDPKTECHPQRQRTPVIA